MAAEAVQDKDSPKSNVQSPKFEENQNGTKDDQKRVMTPGEAISAGSDYLVIGRPITQSENKIAAVREILEEIETA